MIHKSLIVIILVALVMQGATSCGSCTRSNWDEFSDFENDVVSIDEDELKIDTRVMEDMVGNIASPIEMASLVKSLNVPFSQKYLATTKNVSTYNTSFAKAFNLGIFGCDLGYINMYERTSLVLTYINAIMKLADGINVGQFFDGTTLKRLATNKQNLDSLVHVSQQSFNKMDRYLQGNHRSNLSILMVAGVWTEGLFLSTQFLKERPNENRLAESIGEQKIMLDKLLLILGFYKKEPYIANVIDELTTIKKIYDGIEISVVPGETKAVKIDGMLTFLQEDVTTVHYTEEQMQAIINTAEAVRNKLIL